MRMNDPADWRDLYWCEGLARARAIATSIAAMEYDVRLRNATTALPVLDDEEDWGGGYIIEARSADWNDLVDVIDQIIDEQQEFDQFVEDWHGRAGRLHRVFLGVVIGLVIVLAILGMIEL